MNNNLQDQIKSWIFPSLVSILGMMIWNDVNEIKSDVKALMAQSNIDKTRIDNLERELYKSSNLYKIPFPLNNPYKKENLQKVAMLRKEDDEYYNNKNSKNI